MFFLQIDAFQGFLGRIERQDVGHGGIERQDLPSRGDRENAKRSVVKKIPVFCLIFLQFLLDLITFGYFLRELHIHSGQFTGPLIDDYLQIVMGFLQRIFQPFAGRVINDGGKDTLIAVFESLHGDALELAIEYRAAFSCKSDLASFYALSSQDVFQVTEKNLPPVCIGNKTGKRSIDQESPLDPEELCAGKIYLLYHSSYIKGEIADRGKVIEFGIGVPRYLKFIPGLEEFCILHLQFNLMDLKFMDELLRRFLVLGWRQFGRRQPFLRPATQFGCC